MAHGATPHPSHVLVNGVIHTEIGLTSLEHIAHRDGLTITYPEPGTSGHATTYVPRENLRVAAWIESAGGAA